MTDLEIAEWVGFYYGLQRAGNMHVAHTTDEAGRTLNALRRLIQAEMDKTEAKLPPGALEEWPSDTKGAD
jgi:hypothetical protein